MLTSSNFQAQKDKDRSKGSRRPTTISSGLHGDCYLTVGERGSAVIFHAGTGLSLNSRSRIEVSNDGFITFSEDTLFRASGTNISVKNSTLYSFGEFYLNDSGQITLTRGRLEIRNLFDISHASIDLSDFSQINLSGSGSHIVLDSLSTLDVASSDIRIYSGNKLSANQSSITLKKTCVQLNSALFTMTDSHLLLNDRSTLWLRENSRFTTLGTTTIWGSRNCVGHTSYMHTATDRETVHQQCIERGDVILIEDSSVNLGEDTVISSSSFSLSRVRWKGLLFTNSTNNVIKADISGISLLSFVNSSADIFGSTISDISTFEILDESLLSMGSVDFSSNKYGIYLENSYLTIVKSKISKNGSSGIKVSIQGMLKTDVVTISENKGTGIDIINGSAVLSEVVIEDNLGVGLRNMGDVAPLLMDKSIIRNNRDSEIFTTDDGFPIFNLPPVLAATVEDRIYPETDEDLYLLKVIPPINYRLRTIPVRNVRINTNDPARFYPDKRNFSFDSTLIPVQLLFEEATDLISHEDYPVALDSLKSLISQYPESDEALQAVTLLPYIVLLMDGDLDALHTYIESIDNEYLSDKTSVVKARIKLFEKSYHEAIALYENIINEPPDNIAQLIAELEQAYAYFKLTMQSTKSLPVKATHRPQDYSEFVQIQQSIIDRFSLLATQSEEPELIPLPQTFSVTNYPNPFNPETTISFSLPNAPLSANSEDTGKSEGLISRKVQITIYNIKGQRVKSLLDDTFTAGNHKVIWNSTDDFGRTVGSGVYLYRIQAGEYSATKKMLLMK